MTSPFCKCSAMCMFEDKGSSAEYKCPVCSARYELEPKHTMLYFHKRGDDSSLFNSLLKSASQDITNMRVDKPCPKCTTPYRTFMQVGQDAQNFLLCWCGYQERVM